MGGAERPTLGSGGENTEKSGTFVFKRPILTVLKDISLGINVSEDYRRGVMEAGSRMIPSLLRILFRFLRVVVLCLGQVSK